MVAWGLVLAMSLAAAEAENGDGTPAVEPEVGDTSGSAAESEATATEEPEAATADAAAEAATAGPDPEAAATAEPAPASDSIPGDALEPLGPPGPSPKLDAELERRIKSSRRRRAEDAILNKGDGGDYGDPGVEPGSSTLVGELRPDVLRPRWPGGALALGAFVGFGAGYYYAGVPRWGLVFSLVDAVLVGGFVASTVVLNNLVIEHDFNQGKSLARNERDFTKREQRWYTASVIFALAGVGSRAFQAFGGLRAARRTNATLESFSFVPLGDGGALELQLSW